MRSSPNPSQLKRSGPSWKHSAGSRFGQVAIVGGTPLGSHQIIRRGVVAPVDHRNAAPSPSVDRDAAPALPAPAAPTNLRPTCRAPASHGADSIESIVGLGFAFKRSGRRQSYLFSPGPGESTKST